MPLLPVFKEPDRSNERDAKLRHFNLPAPLSPNRGQDVLARGRKITEFAASWQPSPRLRVTDAKELCSDRTPHGSSLSMLHTDFVTNPNNPAGDNPGKDPLTGHNTLAC